MCGSDDRPGFIAEQDRQAVGSHCGAGGFACVVHRSVCVGRVAQCVGGIDDDGAVDLIEVGNGQPDLFLHDFTIAAHGIGIISDVRTEVQTLIHALAHAAVAGGNQGFHVGGRRPIGSQEIFALRSEV